MFSYFIRTKCGGSCLLSYKLPTTSFGGLRLEFPYVGSTSHPGLLDSCAEKKVGLVFKVYSLG